MGTVIVMPLTYSIGYGLIAGLACWLGMQAVFSFLKLAFKIEKPDFSMLAEGAARMSIINAVSSAAAADVADDGEADEDKKEVKKLDDTEESEDTNDSPTEGAVKVDIALPTEKGTE